MVDLAAAVVPDAYVVKYLRMSCGTLRLAKEGDDQAIMVLGTTFSLEVLALNSKQ
jgi:hypothetical protein